MGKCILYSLLFFFLISCSDDDSGSTENYTCQTGVFTDSRDGHAYKWVKIGNQVWMAENLAYLPEVWPDYSGSDNEPVYYVYGFKDSSLTLALQDENYINYGVLYNWLAADEACPEGWHLPSDDEWEELANFISEHNGGYEYDVDQKAWAKVGRHLKDERSGNNGIGWYMGEESEGRGTNDYCFSALPGGYKYYAFSSEYDDRDYSYNLHYYGVWWSSTITAYSDSSYCSYRYLNADYSGFFRSEGLLSYGFSVRCVKD